MDRWMGGWMGRCMNGWMSRQVDGWEIAGKLDGVTVARMGG